MSNFTSLENIITEIQSLILKMNAGKLQMEELESLNLLTRDLNERIVILKYKAYEEKVFGVTPETEMEKQLVSGKEIHTVISEMSDFLTNDSTVKHEEVQQEAINENVENELEIEEETTDESPIFGFDLFESDIPASFAPEVKMHKESSSETHGVFSKELEEKEEVVPAEEEEKIEEITPVYSAPVQQEKVEEVPTDSTSNVEEEKIEETIDEEYIQSEEITSISTEDIFKSFQGLDSGSRLMSPKIHTLVGAFGLNEKLQCIRELYNGSSDAFNQAIEKVNNQTSFEAAKRILAVDAISNSWNLDSNLVNEFLQKVERRFL